MSLKKDKKTKKYKLDICLKSGKRLRMTGFTDYRASLKLQEQILSLDACKLSQEKPDRNSIQWIEGLPVIMKEKLANYNLIDKLSFEKSKSIEQHLTDFTKYKENQASMGVLKPKEVQVMTARIKRIIKDCDFSFISDISLYTIENWVAELYTCKILAPKTLNHHTQTFKHFVKWLCQNNRLSENPIALLGKIRINSENMTFTRRSLSEEEINKLIWTVNHSTKKRCRQNGFQRSLIYMFGLYAGLRYTEVATLRRDDIDLDNSILRIRDVNTKNKKTTLLPLQKVLAEEITEYFKYYPALPFTKIFQDMPSYGTVLIKKDLIEAGIETDSPAGRVDFHALRHTYCTRLARSGIIPQVAQKLMRHSSIDLTCNFYSHLLLEDQQEAIEKLPALALHTVSSEQVKNVSGNSEFCISANTQNTGDIRLPYSANNSDIQANLNEVKGYKNTPKSRAENKPLKHKYAANSSVFRDTTKKHDAEIIGGGARESNPPRALSALHRF